jgi:hypothetical protein
VFTVERMMWAFVVGPAYLIGLTVLAAALVERIAAPGGRVMLGLALGLVVIVVVMDLGFVHLSYLFTALERGSVEAGAEAAAASARAFDLHWTLDLLLPVGPTLLLALVARVRGLGVVGTALHVAAAGLLAPLTIAVAHAAQGSTSLNNEWALISGIQAGADLLMVLPFAARIADGIGRPRSSP